MVRLQSNVDPSFYRMLGSTKEGALLESFTIRKPSFNQRMEAGKALRKQVPRASHAIYDRSSHRADPIDILERQNATRVQKLVPVRYSRMLANPFAFLRGSAAVMASDLSTSPVSGIRVAACGDMHISNFGVYATAERNLVFSINDFDEIHVGPWEWDLKRLAASATVAANFLGGDQAQSEEAARECVRSYRKHIDCYAEMGYLSVWYQRIDERAILGSLSPESRRLARNVMDRAKARGHITTFDKLTEPVKGHHRFIEDVPLIVRETHTEKGTSVKVALDRFLHSYIRSLGYDRKLLLSRYHITDVARKVVGVGSVGTECWMLMLEGASESDPLFLQIKEANASVLAPYVDLKLPFRHHGQRVVFGQRLTQGSPDIFLGWGEVEGKQFYIRQLADMKGGVKVDNLETLPDYCRLCGWALALAHAKSGDVAMIAGYCGKSDALDDALAKFAASYARQTEQDYEALSRAKRTRRIRVAGK
ncbi:DUF2252 domain-containing protein [Bradyrhizobium sp. CCGUVB1N3]|uniref:DUF2252 domain-containing protein n=1 Tax=Bradyrhizobium sp. CCGUVB1N3 TaxID=2949629 RepID=UPI0020B32A67|nr:DUF2252 domain-containing protein [Bradyrhizobium sp. CCGUVB1N3]MCP3473095.1 DUF2252 domain-containing protein [Bradyrhizobium sp. CCGUVB1N3]